MTNNIASRDRSEIAEANFDPFLPLSSQSLFWHSSYKTDSPVLEAVPLLFWLVESLRPRVAVTLGMADGTAHFAVCQATEKLGLENVCFGIQLDASEADFADLQEYNQANYVEFSQLLQASHRQAAETLDEAEIDLLIVTQELTQDLQDEIDLHWLPRMSDRGAILFIGGGEGLRSYTKHISKSGNRLILNLGIDVYLALCGDHPSDRLNRLCKMKVGQPGYLAMRNVFARLGQLHSNTVLITSLTKAGASARAQRDQASKELTELKTKLEEEAAITAKVSGQLKEKVTQLATLQAKQFDIEAISAKNAELARKIEALETELEQAQDASANAAQANAIAQADAMKEQASQVLALTEKLEAAETAKAELEAGNEAKTAELNASLERLARMEKDLKAAKKAASSAKSKSKSKTAKLKEALSRIEAAEQKAAAQEATVQQAQNDIEELQATKERLSTLEQELDDRIMDIAELGNEIEALSGKGVAPDPRVADLQHRIDDLTRELREKQVRLQQVEVERDDARHRVTALEESNSWRITAPLRKATLLVKGKNDS